MWILAQISDAQLHQAEDAIARASEQPVSWWMAALTVGSLVCIYLTVRMMMKRMSENNAALLAMVKEKDDHIRHLNEKLIDSLEKRWDTR